MNINLNKNIQNYQLYPGFQDQASPYLSPLLGLNSPQMSLHQEDLMSFDLEDEEVNNQNLDYDMDLSSKYIAPLAGQSSPNDVSDQDIKMEKKEAQTPSCFIKPSQSKVESIIRFLVSNDKLSQSELKTLGKPLYQNQDSLQYVFQTLMMKFKKLKKTKEQMTKFCMRKAFKFANQDKKPIKKKSSKDKTIKDSDIEQIQFQMPFKKNSSQKTMNNQYLRNIFSKEEFASEYRNFLKQIHQIIVDDNDGKIIYLSNMIEGLLINDQRNKIDNIKRLPWTQKILKKTQELAFSLIQFSEPGSFTDLKPSRMMKKQRNQN